MLSSRFKLKENVTYSILDKYKKPKKFFVPNSFGNFIYKAFGVLPELFLFGSMGYTRTVSNLVTNAGVALVAGRINGSGSPAAATFIALGTGTTAANVTDTTLQTEITTNGGQRAGSSVSLVTTDVTNDTAQLSNTFAFTGSFAVTESGVLNAASGGTLLARQVFSAINVTSGDSLQISWRFDVD